MNVSLHARGQLLGRMAAPDAVAIIRELEEAKPPKGSEARIVRRSTAGPKDKRWGLSNGGVLVAIIEKGNVRTVMWRRDGQDMSAEHFRVDRVRDVTPLEEREAAIARAEAAHRRRNEHLVNRLRKAWGAR